MKIVLDADVLVGALDGSDPHHADARALFARWNEQDLPRLMSVVNLSEVLVAPSADARRLRAAREAIAALGVAIQQPGEAIGVQAARLRSRQHVSLPDAYCLATAKHLGASVMSFDRNVMRAATAERIGRAASER